jgi:hypothetical protein
MLKLSAATNRVAKRIGYLGIRAMGASSINSLGHSASQKRVRRWLRSSILVLSVVLAASICVLPARMAFAAQVLELPADPASSPDGSADRAGEPLPHRHAMAPTPSGLGSIDDYERQGESPSSAGIGSAGSNPRIDPNGPNRDRQALVNNVILGALAIGLFAMEVHAAHQHRHR